MKFFYTVLLLRSAVLIIVVLSLFSCSKPSPEAEARQFADQMVRDVKRGMGALMADPRTPYKDIKVYRLGNTLGVTVEFTVKDEKVLPLITNKGIKQGYFKSIKRLSQAKLDKLKTMFSRGLYVVYKFKKPSGAIALEVRIDKHDKW